MVNTRETAQLMISHSKKNDYYWKARSYAHHLEPTLYRDIVHDAFVDYALKNNKNLFDEPLALIFRVVRYRFYDFLKVKHGWNGKEKNPTRSYIEYNDHLINRITPLDELEGIQLNEQINSASTLIFTHTNSRPNLLNSILDLKKRGYMNKEISQVLSISPTLITYYLKRLMSYINNPFTDKKEKGRSISAHQWDKLSDKEDYLLEEENEFYVLYRHKESGEGLLVKLPAQKMNPYIK